MRRLHSRRRAPRNAAHESAVTSPAVGAQRQRNFQLPFCRSLNLVMCYCTPEWSSGARSEKLWWTRFLR